MPFSYKLYDKASRNYVRKIDIITIIRMSWSRLLKVKFEILKPGLYKGGKTFNVPTSDLPTAPLTVPNKIEPWVGVELSRECCITKEPLQNDRKST